MSSFLVATFYRFAPLDDLESMQAAVRECCETNEVRGIVLLAAEGVNATISGTPEGVMAVIEFLRADPRLTDLRWKESTASKQPFRKMRVRLKKEIVTMGVPGVDPAHLVGTYVKPQDWNALINDPDVIVIDTRNDYEVEIGSFKDAVNPDIESFGQLPAWLDARFDPSKQPRVAMFCTGGIRCEKSTALLRQEGFEEVYHLEGGILKYLEQVPEDESLWHGQCFVFDERVSVGHGLEEGSYELCRGCRRPVGPQDRASEQFEEGVSCPWCHDRTTSQQKANYAQRQQQVDLAKDRGEQHLGH
ncbi:MAG: rhodanese-related sulfurtransferase [Phycisphaerales bacterium]|nr:rhodanese-related sulfurtransferase [Phycisphaerales bacterium]